MTNIGDPAPDWGQIEKDYRAGVLSIRSIARRHGTSHTMIRNRAAAEGWQRATPEIGKAVAVSRTVPAVISAGSVGHRRLVEQGCGLVARLMSELSMMTSHSEAIEQLILDATQHDENGRRRTAMLYAVGLGSRATILKNLCAAAKSLAESAPKRGAAGLVTMTPHDRPVDTSGIEYLLQ